VSAIRQEDGEVRAATRDGQAFRARAAIVTAPRNALGTIDFDPALSEPRRRAVGGTASQGLKVWAKVAGRWDPFLGLGPSELPLNNVASEFHKADHTVVVGFGIDATRLDGNDPAQVQDCLRRWFPRIQVLASTGHDWVADEFSRETWPALSPGQLTDLEELHHDDGRVHLAGSGYARGWAGYIDGAIESGIRTARTVASRL
jgi:monoamine oxidase